MRTARASTADALTPTCSQRSECIVPRAYARSPLRSRRGRPVREGVEVRGQFRARTGDWANSRGASRSRRPSASPRDSRRQAPATWKRRGNDNERKRTKSARRVFPQPRRCTHSVRPLTPPNADPCHLRPVTSWNGRVEISLPAAATPMMVETPQPAENSVNFQEHRNHARDAAYPCGMPQAPGA